MNVETLLQDKKLEYHTQGGDFLVRCLNPEHDDSNPSMRIDKITGIFNCFSCGFKGSLFTFFNEQGNFLQIKKDLFKSKIHQKLADNVGLDIPDNAIPVEDGWRGIRAETFQEFQAFTHNDTPYIGRIVFPIRNISGKIVGFNGRALSPDIQPKYRIHPPKAKFPLYPSRPEPIKGNVILVEGIFDMLNLYDKGLRNAVCAFGTKKLTKDKVAILKMQGITGIDIFFDGDEAGITAAEEVKNLIEKEELATRVISYANKDPGELTAQQVIKLKEKLYG